MTTGDSTDAVKQLRYLAGALKAPRITEAAQRLADQARDAGWTYEDYLAAVLEREVSARNASGAHPARSLRVGVAVVAAVGRMDMQNRGRAGAGARRVDAAQSEFLAIRVSVMPAGRADSVPGLADLPADEGSAGLKRNRKSGLCGFPERWPRPV
jgi:hypothetical protein